MRPEKANKFIEDMREAVRAEIKISVNGKIDALKIQVDSLHKKVDLLKKETDPLVEGKKAIASLRKFVIWIATPATILWAVIKYIK